MRTQEEVVERIRSSKGMFDREVYVTALDFEHAREFLNEKGKAKGADEWPKEWPLSEEKLLAEMRNYAVFAWGKVEDHRGISASRSVEKMGAWLWLLGKDDVLREMQETDYAQYGAPMLAVVCRAMGFPVPDDEPIQRMIRGEPCFSGCEEGCGS